jgi:hypothetical protein
MRLFLSSAALLLGLVLAMPARAETSDPFPTNSIKARSVIQDRLTALSITVGTALDHRPSLERLAADLGKRYSKVPALTDLKRLLIQMDVSRWSTIEPDRAPLQLYRTGERFAFARQDGVRETNPDMKAVAEQTWPADLSHGEKVALQVYSGAAASAMNRELHARGTVPPLYAQIHARMQSAFRKARPFDTPITISRGISLQPAQLTTFVNGVKAAQKDKKPYVMPGYVSTTYGPRVYSTWAGGNVHIHIKATHGLDLFPISLYPEEREVLLNHNNSYNVTGIRQEGVRWIINLEQIPPGKAAKDTRDSKEKKEDEKK